MSRREQPSPEPAFWRRVWSHPEQEISTAAFGGELLVSGVRLLLILVLIYFPVRELLQNPAGTDPLALLTTATLGLFLALMLYAAANRHWGRSWISFASSLLDVSLVSGMLALFLFLERPHEATNDLVIFPVYFLAIGATSLRYDSASAW